MKWPYTYAIKRVLKQVHPDLTISTAGIKIMDAFVLDVFERLATEAGATTMCLMARTYVRHMVLFFR